MMRRLIRSVTHFRFNGVRPYVGLLLLSSVLCACAAPPDDPASSSAADTTSAEDRQRIVQFWELHRQATRSRMAGNLHEAVRLYEATLRLQPDHEDALYYLANTYLDLGQLSEADRTLTRLVARNPGSARALIRRGEIHLCYRDALLFNPTAASADFELALSLNKEETGPMLRLGQSALLERRHGEARHWLDAITATHSSSIEAHFLLGLIDWIEDDRQSALLNYDLALRLVEANPPDPVIGEGDRKTGGAVRPDEQDTCPLMLELLGGLFLEGEPDVAPTAFDQAQSLIDRLHPTQ